MIFYNFPEGARHCVNLIFCKTVYCTENSNQPSVLRHVSQEEQQTVSAVLVVDIDIACKQTCCWNCGSRDEGRFFRRLDENQIVRIWVHAVVFYVSAHQTSACRVYVIAVHAAHACSQTIVSSNPLWQKGMVESEREREVERWKQRLMRWGVCFC